MNKPPRFHRASRNTFLPMMLLMCLLLLLGGLMGILLPVTDCDVCDGLGTTTWGEFVDAQDRPTRQKLIACGKGMVDSEQWGWCKSCAGRGRRGAVANWWDDTPLGDQFLLLYEIRHTKAKRGGDPNPPRQYPDGRFVLESPKGDLVVGTAPSRQ